MSDNKEVAKQLILDAGRTIMSERPGIHGSAENSFQMIADMWSVYLRHIFYARNLQEVKIKLEPVDVAQMMVQLKQARSIYGSRDNRDNFVDSIGYSALAGMMQLPEPYEPLTDIQRSVRDGTFGVQSAKEEVK